MNCRRMLSVVSENSAKLSASFVLALQTSLCSAQQAQPQTYPYGGHMMWGGGWFGMLFGILSMFLILVAIVGGFALVARWFGAARHEGHPPQHPYSSREPLDILKERYARGEIDKDEFEERRRVLSE